MLSKYFVDISPRLELPAQEKIFYKNFWVLPARSAAGKFIFVYSSFDVVFDPRFVIGW